MKSALTTTYMACFLAYLFSWPTLKICVPKLRDALDSTERMHKLHLSSALLVWLFDAKDNKCSCNKLCNNLYNSIRWLLYCCAELNKNRCKHWLIPGWPISGKGHPTPAHVEIEYPSRLSILVLVCFHLADWCDENKNKKTKLDLFMFMRRVEYVKLTVS